MKSDSIMLSHLRGCTRGPYPPLRSIAATALALGVMGFAPCFAQDRGMAGLGDIGEAEFDKLESVMARKALPTDVIHPCDAFSIEQLTALVGEDARSAKVERGHVQSNATCSYKWERAHDREAHKAEVQAALMDAIRAGGDTSAKMKVMTRLASQNQFELSINFHHDRDFKEEADTIAALDLMVERLSKGVASGTFSYRASLEPVESLGGKAVWNANLRQVTVASGKYLYHVRLNRRGEVSDDRKGAEAVARIVADAL